MQMKNFALWAIIISMFLIMLSLSQKTMRPVADTEMTTSEFMDKVESGALKDFSINIETNTITGETKDGKAFKAVVPVSTYLLEKLDKLEVSYDTKEAKTNSALATILINVLPFILFIGIAFWFMRSMQGKGGGGAMSFGKSRAKMLTETQGKVTFDDVAGVEMPKMICKR